MIHSLAIGEVDSRLRLLERNIQTLQAAAQVVGEDKPGVADDCETLITQLDEEVETIRAALNESESDRRAILESAIRNLATIRGSVPRSALVEIDVLVEGELEQWG